MIKVLVILALAALACRALLGKWPWAFARGPDTGDSALIKARRLLHVPPGASAAEIREAHRCMVGERHPDRGGSTMATQDLNAARDLLLAQLPKHFPERPQ